MSKGSPHLPERTADTQFVTTESLWSPEWALERLLRKGVANVCSGDGFQIADIKYEIMEVMERWKSPYRTITAVASCGRQP